MDTKKLKQKILDLAIHGKLVPQDPNDEPASVLLERIRAEKERLIKEGKIKKSKKTVTTSDTSHYGQEPFEVPEGWEWCRGNEIFIPMSSTKPTDDTFLYIDIDAIDNKLNTVSPKTIKTSDAPSRASRYIESGDTLFSMVRPYLRNIAKIDIDNCIASTGFYICHSYDCINKDYIFYLMLSDYVVDGLNMFMKGDNSPSINASHIDNWLFPIPPYAEQCRIVAEIKNSLSLVSNIEDNRIELEFSIKQAKSKILELAIHGKLVPQDPNDEPASELLKRINPKATIATDNAHYEQLPVGWCFCHIKDVFNVTMGQSPKGESINRSEGIEFHQGKLSFGGKYLNNSYSYTSEPTKYAEPQSILICVRAPVGIVNITDRKICIGRGLAALYPSKSINLDYGFYLLQCCKESFEAQSTGSTFKAISGDIIKNEVITIPPIAEQQRIVSKIETLFNTLDAIAENL